MTVAAPTFDLVVAANRLPVDRVVDASGKSTCGLPALNVGPGGTAATFNRPPLTKNNSRPSRDHRGSAPPPRDTTDVACASGNDVTYSSTEPVSLDV